MTPVAIIRDLLKSIPAPVRKGLLGTYAVAVVVSGALAIADVDTGVLDPVLLYIGGYLGVQSAANIPPKG